MKIKIKPKTFGPAFVRIDNSGNLQFGEAIEHLGTQAPDLSSPAISLLYSLGSCIALSIQMVAKGRKIAINPFLVEVDSSKAEDVPVRFGRFIVKIDGNLVDDAGLARDIIAQAKSICTVSNTLNADITLVVKREEPINETQIV